jgi:hypothetical protein
MMELSLGNRPSQAKIQYPDRFTTEDILAIYRNRGLLTLTDAGVYLERVSHVGHRATLTKQEQRVVLATRHPELERVPRILLDEVLVLDQRLGQEGQLLALYWEAFAFHEAIYHLRHPRWHEDLSGNPWTKQEAAFASALIHLCLRKQEPWMAGLRAQWQP